MDRSGVDADETVVFFPAVGWREGGEWRLRVHGWIYEPVEYSRIRRAALWLARRAVRRRVGGAVDEALTRSRLASFFTDNERGERVRVRCAGREFAMERSRADGHFEGTVTISAAEAERVGGMCDGALWVPFQAMLRAGDERCFQGRGMLLEEKGTSVISDIDDTIKVTGVLQRKTMLRSTFCEAFASVPGMAELYRRLQRRHGAAFHYVSASPWQLYPFLTDGLAAAGFPAGTFHLRRLRFKGRSLLGALASSLHIKRRHVQELMTRFPRRKFVLVGDSSERDGVLYAGMARKHTGQVAAIYIRDAGGTKGRSAREWERVFHGVAGWQVFRDPIELL